VCFGIVDAARTTDLPDGDAAKAWKGLLAKYEPSTESEKVKLDREFATSKLKSSSDDPDAWLTELERKRQRMRTLGMNKDDDDLIRHVLNNLPKDYDSTVENLEDKMSKKELTIEILRDKLNSRYEKLSSNRDEKGDDTSDEKALVMGGRKFKGNCRLCGKIGHKANDCWDNEKNKDKRPKNYQPSGDHRAGQQSGNDQARNFNSDSGNKKKFDGHCHFCKKYGHHINDCYKKKKRDEREESANVSNETSEHVLTVTDVVDGSSGDIWIADSGATSHMTNSLEGMYDIVDMSTSVTVGNGKQIKIEKSGKLKGVMQHKDGSRTEVVLTNVKYVPELWCNLFSVISAMKQGWKLSGEKVNNETVMKLTKNSLTIGFDQKVKASTTDLLGVKFLRAIPEAAMTNLQPGTKVKTTTLHYQLGHPSEAVTRATAKYMDVNVTGKLETCENCAMGKAKQKNVPKVNENVSTVPGERLYIDISSIKERSIGGSKFWLLAVDEATHMKWSFFLKSKDQTTATMIPFLKELKAKYFKSVKFIRCDNAGENRILEKATKDAGMGITFEYTAPGTPQQNAIVERAFATLMGRTRAMMNLAGFPKKKRNQLWTEAANTATKIDNMLIYENDSVHAHKKFYGTDPGYMRYLRTFGEIAITTNHENKQGRSKVEDRGRECMFLGYADNHANDVYRFLHLKTTKVILSRDVIWLKKMYAEHENVKRVKQVAVDLTEDDTDEDDDSGQEGSQANANDPVDPVHNNDNDLINPPQVDRELRRIETWEPVTVYEGRTRGATRELSELAFVSAVTSDINEPKTFAEAMASPDKEKWLEAIKLELSNMKKRDVWKLVKKSSMPPNRRMVGCKWVFKIKADGTYRARLVAQGFSQIPGVDFTENFAPVMNDETLRIMLLFMLLTNSESEQIDVETAFLYGELQELIYMMCPEGLEIPDDECVLLTKSIYGLVQAARQWYKKFIRTLKSIGFNQCLTDPCLLCKDHGADGMVILAIYVDDCICIGKRSAIDWTIKEIEKHFIIKKMGEVKNYVGCRITKLEGKSLLLTQPELLKGLERKFGNIVRDMRYYNTPAMPNDIVMRPQIGDPLLSKEDQQLYRSGVGMLLYLTKHSRPDISNAVRELSKVMDGATECHMKNMLRCIKFVIDTKEKGLLIAPFDLDDVWEFQAFCDSDYSGDRDKRLSVTGYIIYLMGVAIAWKARAQRSVTLSSTEAEYVAISEVCREILFVAQVLEFLKLKVKRPIVVRVDNVGAIYMANNQTTSQRTKHVDVRYHFVREYIEDGMVKIIFVKSKDNDADIFTKNLDGETYWRHANKFLADPNNRKGVGE
jgi:hypothetical protein